VREEGEIEQPTGGVPAQAPRPLALAPWPKKNWCRAGNRVDGTRRRYTLRLAWGWTVCPIVLRRLQAVVAWRWVLCDRMIPLPEKPLDRIKAEIGTVGLKRVVRDPNHPRHPSQLRHG
jgi:hypothetical protein